MILTPQKNALLIIDVQEGFLNGPEAPYLKDQVLTNINLVIRQARMASVPIFFSQHTGPEGSPVAADSAGWRLAAGLEWAEGDTLLQKNQASCFDGTELQARLIALGVDTVVLAGMNVQSGVDSTCRVAHEVGFKPVLVLDAHTCLDTAAGRAKHLIACYNETLTPAFARGVVANDAVF
ncbi:MAG: isochorismatase family protein [Neisseriaceae bacterium]|nr:isochorismatase family protein [Neisseriaceae bacterium]MBP6861521.1 isochorismatase family protein [Neisseriaceae bacterium]